MRPRLIRRGRGRRIFQWRPVDDVNAQRFVGAAVGFGCLLVDIQPRHQFDQLLVVERFLGHQLGCGLAVRPGDDVTAHFSSRTLIIKR
jgi:hypothetical protein